MTAAVQLATFLWLGGWAVRAVRDLATGRSSAFASLVLAHAFFCGVPLALDLAFGAPRYAYQPGWARAASDPATLLLYCAYVAACPVLWHLHERRGSRLPSAAPRVLPPAFIARIRLACLLLALLPLLLVLLSPDRGLYLDYALSVKGLLPEGAGGMHNVIASSAIVAVLAVAVYLTTLPLIELHDWLLAAISITVSCWVFGKRLIVALALVTLGYVLWSRGYLFGRRLYLALVAGLIALLAFSFYYQSSVRYVRDPALYAGVQTRYESFRIDFFRDDRIKMTLYAELHPEAMQILEYRGQSLLFNVLFPVPRRLWPDKPWPYSVYVTSALLGIYPARSLGWSVTTSWLEEAVANFGWLGLAVGPLLLSGLCRVGEASRWTALRVLTAVVVVLFMAVQLSAFMAVFLLWLCLATLSRLEGIAPAPAPQPT